MEKFTGKKFRPTGEIITHRNYDTNELESREGFAPTWAYLNYLKKQKVENLKWEISLYKHKLERQEKDYGEVDSIDLGYYQGLLKELEQLTQKSKEPKRYVVNRGNTDKYPPAPTPYLPKPGEKRAQ